MSRRTAVVLTLVIIVLSLAAVAGSTDLSGPEVFKVTTGHGVHLLDLFVLVVAVIGLLFIWRSVIPEHDRRTAEQPR